LDLFEQPTFTGRPRRIGSGTDWRNVALGYDFALALKVDSSLWSWGQNRSGQLGKSRATGKLAKPTRVGLETNWTRVSAGQFHCMALKGDDSLWAWGQNEHGEVGDGSTNNKFAPTMISPDHDWQAIAAGAFNGYALKKDGTVWGWGLDPISGGATDVLSPRQIDPDTNWVSISAGTFHLAALKAAGTLWVRGQNAHVAASAYVGASSVTFIKIGDDSDWSEIYSGRNYFFARKKDGSWWVCGGNEGGLGVGATGSQSSLASPQRLPFGFEPWAFSTGWRNTALLTKDGTLWTWGARLGASDPVWLMELKAFVNRTFGGLSRRLPFQLSEFPVDPAPYKLWELPSEVRQSLGKDLGERSTR
jgi:alpha-tubulin suppressor-like RCC1 family protein